MGGLDQPQAGALRLAAQLLLQQSRQPVEQRAGIAAHERLDHLQRQTNELQRRTTTSCSEPGSRARAARTGHARARPRPPRRRTGRQQAAGCPAVPLRTAGDSGAALRSPSRRLFAPTTRPYLVAASLLPSARGGSRGGARDAASLPYTALGRPGAEPRPHAAMRPAPLAYASVGSAPPGPARPAGLRMIDVQAGQSQRPAFCTSGASPALRLPLVEAPPHGRCWTRGALQLRRLLKF